jgi:hypothetical protein
MIGTCAPVAITGHVVQKNSNALHAAMRLTGNAAKASADKQG